MRSCILVTLLFACASAFADELPRLASEALLKSVAQRIDASARVVEVVVRAPTGSWRPSPLRRRGVAVMVGEGDRRALLTAVALLEDAADVELMGPEGKRLRLKAVKASGEHGIAALVPAGNGTLPGLKPFVGVPLAERSDELIKNRQVFLRDRWEAASDTRSANRQPAFSSSIFGRGKGYEGYFSRVGVVPSPGEPIVDAEARLVAVGLGPSRLEKGAVGLAIPWRFVQLYLREVLKWPAPQAEEGAK